MKWPLPGYAIPSHVCSFIQIWMNIQYYSMFNQTKEYLHNIREEFRNTVNYCFHCIKSFRSLLMPLKLDCGFTSLLPWAMRSYANFFYFPAFENGKTREQKIRGLMSASRFFPAFENSWENKQIIQRIPPVHCNRNSFRLAHYTQLWKPLLNELPPFFQKWY